jgi:hypothetical protein
MHSIDVELTENNGNSIPYQPMKISLNGTLMGTYTTDQYGRLSVDHNFDPGNASIT